MFSGFTSQTFI